MLTGLITLILNEGRFHLSVLLVRGPRGIIMDTDVICDENKGESLSQYSIVKKLKGCYQSPKRLPELPTKPSDPLGPVTPDSIREGGNHVDGCCSPVSSSSSLHSTRCFKSQLFGDLVPSNEGSPQTPKGFDPFAPGPDELMLAPQCKKYFTDSQAKVTRQLNFEETLNFNGNVNQSDNVGTVSGDEMLFELLYNSLLEVITAKQKEDLHSKASTLLSDSDGYKTPTFAPHLSGVADMCPGAPMKPANRFKRIHKGLCKKLIF
ncbi:putative protein isoform X1 [Capsicum annuum]|uniref:uncharacterized protein LOC107848340 isoform X1 n=2 Tax=Capsicum annuum TaxID=4072 RepID=UPI001FB0EBAC|nr:uncharacterized protein LOC107848340 isoform X1 [Capsicum annuum]